ncbi:MAG: hypothetical protein LBC96_01485 [Lachnospiraceae bacterium]|nr:hypothetical protein [Lachnospiraceae bacterium]
MANKNNIILKMKDYLFLVFWEIKTNKGIFSFYTIIAVLLFSLSVGLLSLATNIPGLISDELKEINADTINITNISIDDAQSVLSMQVELIDATVTPQNLSINNFNDVIDELFWGGVLLNDITNTTASINFISEVLINGECIISLTHEDDYYPIWMSGEMAEALGLTLNSYLSMYDFDNNELCIVYVAGIFESDEHFISMFLKVYTLF